MNQQSAVLTEGKTPEEWETVLIERGLNIKARKLREVARRIGACHTLGNVMILMPAHIDQIFKDQEQKKCLSNSTHEKASGGSGEESTNCPVADISGKALAHLEKAARKSSRQRSKKGKSNVIMLAETTH